MKISSLNDLIFDNSALIVLNGFKPKLSLLGMLFKNTKIHLATDGAIKNLSTKFKPDFIIGDLDSISTSDKNKYKKILIRSSSQDKTDFHKALELLIAKGFNTIHVISGYGSRLDHIWHNIFLMEKFYKLKIKIFFWAKDDLIFIVGKQLVLENLAGARLSFFALSNKMLINTSGLEYNLKDSIYSNKKIGSISNRISLDKATIKLLTGPAIVFLELKKIIDKI